MEIKKIASVKGGSSIHFRPVKTNSESHNLRKSKLDYVHEHLSKNNVWFNTWNFTKTKDSSIKSWLAAAKKSCKEKTGRKMQDKASPIREAVVNLKAHHTKDDLKKLGSALYEEFGIKVLQTYIHRDEGLKDDKTGEIKINHHAHLVAFWFDFKTGKSLRLQPHQMSKMQKLTADVLGMKRGELKTNTNRERLESVEYKRQQEQKRLDKLQEQCSQEQKKNQDLSKLFQQFENQCRELECEVSKLAEEEKRLENEYSKETDRYTNGQTTVSEFESEVQRLANQKEGLNKRYNELETKSK